MGMNIIPSKQSVTVLLLTIFSLCSFITAQSRQSQSLTTRRNPLERNESLTAGGDGDDDKKGKDGDKGDSKKDESKDESKDDSKGDSKGDTEEDDDEGWPWMKIGVVAMIVLGLLILAVGIYVVMKKD